MPTLAEDIQTLLTLGFTLEKAGEMAMADRARSEYYTYCFEITLYFSSGSYHTSTFLSPIHYLISFLHRAVCFEITLYLSSHFSYSSAAFCNIAQAGGGGEGQGEL